MGSLMGKWVAELADLLIPLGALLGSSSLGSTEVQSYR